MINELSKTDVKKAGRWQRFVFEGKNMSHVRGLLLLGSPPFVIKYREISKAMQVRYAKILEVHALTKPRKLPLRYKRTIPETDSDPALVMLHNPHREFDIVIKKVFYDVILKKWPDAVFVCTYGNRFAYAYSSEESRLKNGLVAIMRPYILHDVQ